MERDPQETEKLGHRSALEGQMAGLPDRQFPDRLEAFNHMTTGEQRATVNLPFHQDYGLYSSSPCIELL